MTISRQLYCDLNFVSSQQVFLLFQHAKIPFLPSKYPVFAIHSSLEAESKIPQGLFPPFLKDQDKVYEGAKNIIHHSMDLEEIQFLRSSPREDGRAQKMMNLALDLENHLFLIEGEFFYGPYVRRLQKQVDSLQNSFSNQMKSNLIELIISRKIPIEALSSSLKEVNEALKKIHEQLSYQITIQGDQFGLADLVWLPLINRLIFLGWPMEKTNPEIFFWYKEALEYFSEYQSIKAMEALPNQKLYSLIKKITWIGGRNLYSTLKLNQII